MVLRHLVCSRSPRCWSVTPLRNAAHGSSWHLPAPVALVLPAFGFPRLNDVREPPISIRGMATVLRRLLTICLAATFLVGATVQLLPSSGALADLGSRAADKMADCNHQMSDCGDPSAPPAKHMPNCIDHVGCLTVPVLEASPTAVPMPFRWTSVAYISGAASLLGQSVQPELSPPILAV